MTTATPPSAIQNQLHTVWENIAKNNTLKASLFNLIFYTKKKMRAEYIHIICQKVLAKFPSRVIFITCDPVSETDFLHTNVRVLPQQEHEIACDFIGIDVSKNYEDRVSFLLLPHILPDLPIYVVWAEDPEEASTLFSTLQTIADRFIFDSESITDLSKFAEQLLKFNKKNLAIADLNWARIESWRDLLTSTFYTQERLNSLQKSHLIQITYNACQSAFCSHTQIQAIYLQSWLSTQLGWTLKKAITEENKQTFFYLRSQSEVEIILYPEYHVHLKAGSILSVDIATEDKDHFSFGRNLDAPYIVSMRFSNLEKCDVPLRYIFSKDESGQSLVKEICHKGTSSHYLNLLETIKNKTGFSFNDSQ